MERAFRGVWIPEYIWCHKELTAVERILYAEIDSLDNENHCTAGNDYFAEFCGVSESTITRSLKKLVELKLIEIVNFDGRHRVIKMTNQSRQIDDAGSSKCRAININNNTSNNINTINSININEDAEDKLYSKDSFLGSRKKKTTNKRQSLYSKCNQSILQYTDNVILQDKLDEYLKIRLAMKDKPIYAVTQWNSMLDKLTDLFPNSVQDKIDCINRSIERGWASFFPNQSNTKRKDVFSEYGETSSEKVEEKYVKRDF